MPGFTTHFLFGEKVYHSIFDHSLKKIIHKNLSAYKIGLQGPDIFFFDLPSLISKGSKNYGSLLHDICVQKFFLNYIKQLEEDIKKNPSIETSAAISYFFGFVCHYILDTHCHPYIYSYTEYNPDKREEKLSYYAKHRTMETQIDTILLRMLKYKNPSSFSKSHSISLNRIQLSSISHILSKAINKTYRTYIHVYAKEVPSLKKSSSKQYLERFYYRDTKACTITPTRIKRSIVSMKLECKILQDHSGWKKHFVQKIEAKTVQYNLLSSLISSDFFIDMDDILNKKKEVWYSPWEKEKARYESFLELFIRAKQKCIKLSDIYAKYIKHCYSNSSELYDYRTTFLKQLGSLSYHSGLYQEDFPIIYNQK